jgi:hypothetical protein
VTLTLENFPVPQRHNFAPKKERKKTKQRKILDGIIVQRHCAKTKRVVDPEIIPN